MKKNNFLVLFFIIFLFYSCEEEFYNEYNENGKKDGIWVEFFDKDWKIIKNNGKELDAEFFDKLDAIIWDNNCYDKTFTGIANKFNDLQGISENVVFYRIIRYYNGEHYKEELIKDYYISGKIQAEIYMSELEPNAKFWGTPNDICKWYYKNNGIKESKIYNEKGELHGESVIYFKHKTKERMRKIEANYKNNKLNGEIFCYYKSGYEKYIQTYEKDTLVKEICFLDKGTKDKTECYCMPKSLSKKDIELLRYYLAIAYPIDNLIKSIQNSSKKDYEYFKNQFSKIKKLNDLKEEKKEEFEQFCKNNSNNAAEQIRQNRTNKYLRRIDTSLKYAIEKFEPMIYNLDTNSNNMRILVDNCDFVVEATDNLSYIANEFITYVDYNGNSYLEDDIIIISISAYDNDSNFIATRTDPGDYQIKFNDKNFTGKVIDVKSDAKVREYIIFPYLISDVSSSLNSTDPGELRLDAAELFVENLNKRKSGKNDMIKLATFGQTNTAPFLKGKSQDYFVFNDKNEINNYIDSSFNKNDGGTPFYDAMNEAIEYFSRRKINNEDGIISYSIVVFTDGENNGGSSSKKVIKNSQESGIPIFIVGLTDGDVDFSELRKIGGESNGGFCSSSNVNKLNELFERFNRSLQSRLLVKVKLNRSHSQMQDKNFSLGINNNGKIDTITGELD